MHRDKALQIIAENRKSYNAIAQDFDVARQTAWPEFESLAPYIKEGTKILDIGCGNGRLYDYISSKFKVQSSKYIGVDQSEELIKIACKNYPDVNFQVADVFDLPFRDREFDVAAGIAFLHHIPSRELRVKCLKEIYRVLKPGGILFLTNWNLWPFDFAQGLRQWRALKKYKLPFFDFFFPHQDLDAGDFCIPFKYNCHSERSEESRDPSGLHPQDDRVLRYYHHFKKTELVGLAKEAGLKLIKFIKGKNLIAIFKK